MNYTADHRARVSLGLALLILSSLPLRPAQAEPLKTAEAEQQLRAAAAELAAALSSVDIDHLSRLWHFALENPMRTPV